MGFLNNLVLKLFGAGAKSQAASQTPSPRAPDPGLTVTVSYSGPVDSVVAISDAEVVEAARQYSYVFTNELEDLKPFNQWYEEEAQKRRVRDGAEKAFAWITPFVSHEIARLPQLRPHVELGPPSASGVVKTLRAMVRERRKTKQPYTDLLQALYGASVLADLMESLEFEGMPARSMAKYVDLRELQGLSIDFKVLGYQCINSLGKTDAMWLVDAFGEPPEHQSFYALRPDILNNAISRYCWTELRSSNDTAKSLGCPQRTMQEWLHDRVKINLGYHKQWLEKTAAREAQLAELSASQSAAWAATRTPFAVADLETTGLTPETDEMLEIAAVLVDPDGTSTGEFSMLINVARPVPPVITRLTGITQEEVDRQGRPLPEAMQAFLSFVGDRPVFFHNAPFDQSFLRQAEAKTRLKFQNPVHDTLPLARIAWPSLITYKLVALAEHVDAGAQGSHRALSDTKAALAVLLAARQKLCG